MKKPLLLILVLEIFSAPAFSQGYMKARELRDHIVISLAGVKNADQLNPLSDAVKATIEDTSSYVIGMSDAWNSDHPGFVPKRTGWLELMGVIQRYIDAHPEKLQDAAANVAKLAVSEAYHPKKKAKP